MKRRLNPITFEILRHRLVAINSEAASTVRLVSGSSVATEANDMNTSLMDGDGDVFAVGYYSLAKATTISAVVKEILAEYRENPGIREGDAFICNDPYVGVQHQNDVAFVMPIFAHGEMIAWAGAEIHQVDVGGPVMGQVQVGAKDIFGEQPLIPPVKIMEGHVLRKDVERLYLRHSRFPHLVGLDLRAKIAACNVARERIGQLVADYGLQTVKDGMADMLDYAEYRLRERLMAIPDGTWRHRTYLEYGDDIYPMHVAFTKRDDRLLVDFSGTAKQAPAVINCTLRASTAIVRGYLTSLLCWDIPWCPSATGRVVDIVTEHGTIVDCAFPAGVSKATTSTGWTMGKALTVMVGKMLLSAPQFRENAMASWQGGKTVEELHGIDQRGRSYGGVLLDGMAGGGGAKSWSDGIDTGGYAGSMRVAIANVESYESDYPILYLYRKHAPDTGGAGKFRGGTGISMLYTIHGTDQPQQKVMHTIGAAVALSPGLGGGTYSGTNQFMIKRDTEVAATLASGVVPQEFAAIGGPAEVFPAISQTVMNLGDLCKVVNMGGGGYGDPLDRDPEAVARDVGAGLVTKGFAASAYGVIVKPDRPEPDLAATAVRRQEARSERKRVGRVSARRPTQPPAVTAAGDKVMELTETLSVVGPAEARWIRCRCGHHLAKASENYKEYALEARFDQRRISPECDPNDLAQGRFEAREYYCPSCATLLDVDVAQPEEPILWDVQLS